MIVFERRATTILFNFLRSIGPCKTFLLPANVCPIVPIAFMKARVAFEFVDISPRTLCIDEDEVVNTLRKNTDRYGGLVYVRSYGAMRDVEAFFASIKDISDRLVVIDDRCLVAPHFDESSAGVSDLTLYSTGYSKYVDIDWGGFGFLAAGRPYTRAPLTYRPADLDAVTAQYKACLAARLHFDYADSDWLDGDVPSQGFAEYRDLVSMKATESAQHKALLNAVYREMLPESIQLPVEFQEWRFNIAIPHKEQLLAAIFAAGLFASSHYASADGIFSNTRSPNAEAVHAGIVNLFNDRYFNERQAIQLAEIVCKHVS